MKINIFPRLQFFLIIQQIFNPFSVMSRQQEISNTSMSNIVDQNNTIINSIQNFNYFDDKYDSGFIFNHNDYEHTRDVIEARVLAKNGKLNEALDKINIVNLRQPKDQESLLCKAHILYAMGRLQEAIDILDQYDPTYYNSQLSPANQFDAESGVISLRKEILCSNESIVTIGNDVDCYKD